MSYGHLLPTTFEKVIFFCIFFVKVTPPGRVKILKNAQFLQWILKDDDVYFKKIKES